MPPRAADRTAEVVPAYGFIDRTRWGIRGWRAHCGACGFLSRVHTYQPDAAKHAGYHRCGDRQSSSS